MGIQWWWRTFYIGLIFVYVTQADNRCGGGCRGKSKDSVYKFVDGNVYKYEIEGLSVTTLPGSPNDVSKLSISATAEVSAQPDCYYVLTLSNVLVAGADGKTYDSLSADCSKPVKFSFNNGQLSPELCSEEGDNGAALNIKRAVISLFQTSDAVGSGSKSDLAYETDVFGTCPTNYMITSNDGKIAVQKTRNLNRCAHREHFDFPMLSTPYYSQKSDFQTSPLMAAELSIVQNIENGILKAVTSEEEYEYRPLLNAQYAAKIHNKLSLKYVDARKGSLAGNGNEKQSIIFESPHPSDGVGNANLIIQALQKVVDEIEPSVEYEAAGHFLDLVDVLEHGSKADILTVYSQIKSGAGFKDKEVAKNILLDGLLFAGSAESVEAAAELLLSKEISEASSLKWYVDLSFVKHVSKGSLKAVASLLDGKAPHQAYLGIGALAGKFCHQHDCANVPELQQLLKKLAKPVFDGCKVNSVEQENNIIASLKGLANVKLITDEVATKLSKCAEDGNVKTRIRSAALSAYGTNEVLKKSAIKIFKDIDEDAELRIKAYLALVSSPCAEVADVVKETIDKEPVNQVGSFIVSHLRNLRATTNPDKEAAKHFLGQIIPKKRFPFDIRKFSQNRELSYSLDALNIGAVGESNTIYSQKSYLPRYVNLNLTSNIFGHSFNFLEVAARAENLEYLLESYFGPKGEYNKSLNEVIEDTIQAENYYNIFQKSHRGKRSVTREQINGVAKKVKFGVDFDDKSLDLDFSIKMFGAEVAWLKVNGDTATSFNKIYEKVTGRVEESVNKLKNYDVDYKKGRTFLDATVTYPTALGLALKVKVLGGSAVNIKVDSKVDIKAIIKAIKDKNVDLSTEMKFQIIPSAAVELNSLLAIDADVLQTGVKVSANLHSSTGTDISLRILEGAGIDLKVGLPVKNQELVSFKSNVVSIIRQKGQPESSKAVTFNSVRSSYSGCFDQLSSFIGLTFCGELSAPTEGFGLLSPAFGPGKFVLRVEKEDESLSSYHFKAYYNDKEPNSRSFELLLDTPNSKTNRKLGLLIKASNEPRKELSISAVSPWKQVSLEGFVTDSDKEQSLTAKLINDNQEYSLKVGAEVSGDANRKKYEPLLEYKEPEGGKQWSLVGRKGGAKGGKSQQSVSVTGSVIVERTPGSQYRKYELKSVTVNAHSTKITLDGDITVDKNLLQSDLAISYDKTSFKLNSKLQCIGNKYSAEVDFAPQQGKEFGISLKWNFEKESHKLANNIVLIHGPDLKSEDARFTLSNSVEYKFESYKNFEFETSNSVSYPLLGVSGKFEVEVSPKEVELEVKAGYGSFNMEGKLDAKTTIKNFGDYSIEFSGKFLENSAQLSAKHDIISSTKSKFTNSLELTPGGKYQLNAIVVYNLKGKEIDQSIDLELITPFKPKSVKLNAGVKNNKAESSVLFIVMGDDSPLIEVKGNIEKSNKPESSFKVYLPNAIDSSGSFKFDGKKGRGSFTVDLLKLSRKIEGKGEVTITGSNYKGFAELYWDAKKDSSKKIRVETDTDYTENALDSKNSLQVLNYKTVVNVKGQLQGKFTDGTIVGDTKIILPSGRVLTLKANRKIHLKPGDSEVDIVYELCNYEAEGSQPQKLVFKLAGKNIDLNRGIFDGQTDLSYTSPEQKSVVLHAVGKKVPNGSKWNIAGEGSISGSLVHSMNLKLDSEVSDVFIKGELINDSQLAPIQYQITASDTTMGVSASINGKANGYLLVNELDVSLPADLPVTSLKWVSNNYINIHPVQGEFRKVKYNNAITYNGDKFVKVNVEASEEAKGLSGKLEWESHVASLRTLTGKIIKEKIDNFINTEVEGAFTYEGKTADIVIKVNANPTDNIVNAYVVGNVPNKGKFTADLKHKDIRTSESDHTRDTVLVLTGNDKTLTITSYLQVNKPNSFIMKFLVEAPQGKSGVYIKALKKGLRHYDIKHKFNWISGGGGNLDLDVEFDLEDIEDFKVKVAADSAKLNVNKFELEVGSKAAVKTSAKRITFSAKNAEKPLFSGSANYQVDNKLPASLSLDGNGVLKIGDESYPMKVNFDYKHASPDLKATLSIDAKPYSFVSLHEKKEGSMRVSNKYCKDSACSKVEFIQHAEINKEDLSFSLERELTVDLEKICSYVKNFNYKHSLKKQGIFIDHKFSVLYGQYSSDYHAYIKEQEAGAILTLPHRVIALELKHDGVFTKEKRFPDNVEITFYPNKNNAEEKTCIYYKSDTSKFLKNAATGPYSSEIRFTTPGIRELSVKSHGEVSSDYSKVDGAFDIDVFNKKPNKIVVEYSRKSKKSKDEFSMQQSLKIHSKGQGIDIQVGQDLVASRNSFSLNSKGHYVDTKKTKKESIFKLEADKDGSTVYLQIPEGVILSSTTKVSTTDNSVNWVRTFEMLGHKGQETGKITNNKVHYSMQYDKSLFEADAGFAIGQLAEYKATLNSKPLVNLEIKLDDVNFLKTTYNYDIDSIKELVDLAKEYDLEFINDLSKLSKSIVERVSTDVNARSEEIRKAAPNFKPVFNAYSTHLKKIKEEFETDESLKDVLAAVKNYKILLIDQVIEIYQEIAKSAEALLELANETWGKLNETINKLIPKIADAYGKVCDAFQTLVQDLYKFANGVIKAILTEIKNYDAEIKEFISVITDYIHELGILISRTSKQFEAEIRSYIVGINEQIQALPIFAIIKEKINELKEYQVPDHVIETFSELVQTAKQASPTEEVKLLIDCVAGYIKKLLKHEPLDGPGAVKEVYTHLISALKSLTHFINVKDPKAPLTPLYNFIQYKVLKPLQIYEPPHGGFRLNLFSLLQSPDLPSLSEIYQTYKPTRHILDYFPPYTAYASYSDSTEIVTFDGKQISFKGSCGYILLQDFVDGNFSVAVSLENGKVKSLVFSDHDNIVEIKSDHSIFVNGKAAEYPVIAGDITAWRKYYALGLYSNAGLKVMCVENLQHCSFTLSGFYFSKVRGLLGTYNNEPYDDLSTPQGKVCESSSEFGNAWKTSSQCSDVPEVAHNHVHVDECTEYFTSGSPLQSCFSNVNPSNFRKSCDHKVQEAQGNKKEVLCGIVQAYIGSCLAQRVHLTLPKECISCKAGSQTLQSGDTANVNTPQNSADIVFMIEELDYNEEVYKSLIIPLLPLLTNDLKEKGITDIKFALIGYGAPGQYWPAHYTSNGDIGFNGNAKITFEKPANDSSKGGFIEKLRFIKHQIDLETGSTVWHRALEEIMYYPFRADAVKAVVSVYAKPCEYSASPISLIPLRQFAGKIAVIKTGIKLSVITPLEDLEIEGKDAKATANIVGFDAEAVYTVGKGRGKVLRGDEDAFKNIKYGPDSCVEFAQSVDGAVFSSNNFIQGKPALRKHYLQVISEKITDDLTGVEVQQECWCELDRFYPLTRCKVVNRKEKEMLAKHVKGVKG